MDQTLRNKLQRTTQDARRVLEQEFAEQLEGTYDILPDGAILPKPGKHLDERQRLTRQKLVDSVEHIAAGGKKPDEAVADYTREAAFTFLNRFVALKMLEARGLVQPCISKGDQSSGFKEFAGLAPGLAELVDKGYRLYLECLFDELSVEVKVLFDRRDVASLLWPRQAAVDGLLALLNDAELADVWGQDETIGWVYQYFNSQEERRRMREESQAPRNSRELAVRNQFFTPRYVVEFLTDNTLGRIWYEMRRSRTPLKEKCRYMVRRPYEIFLGGGYLTEGLPGYANIARVLEGDISQLPEDADWDTIESLALCIAGYEYLDSDDLFRVFSRREEEYKGTGRWQGNAQDLWLCLFAEQRRWHDSGPPEGDDLRQIQDLYRTLRAELQKDTIGLSQDELLRHPVVVAYRKPKDPRDLKILDPACGSAHFLLYCFDLLLIIYEDAWAADQPPVSEVTGKRLRDDYPTLERLRAEVPGLILRHNLYGIDIDPRCAQIAAFALWMRAQRAYNDFGISRGERPGIRRTNIVVAEPMPGEKDLLEEFLRDIREDGLEGLMRRALNIPDGQRIRATKAMADSLCELVRAVWNKMRLAGEAGSLLKIDEALADAIAKGRDEWEEKLPLFRITEYGLNGKEKEKYIGHVPGQGEDFWDKAEVLLLAALQAYVEHSGNGAAFRRRLFADDAAQAFGLIGICRLFYEAVLMNPPFGDPVPTTKAYLSSAYPAGAGELYSAFVLRAREQLVPLGRIGFVSSRVFMFKEEWAPWRRDIRLSGLSIATLCDLGNDVLDGALVEAAATALAKDVSTPKLTGMFIEALGQAEKDVAVLSAIAGARCQAQHGASGVRSYWRKLADFANVPNEVWVYSAPDDLIKTYAGRLLKDVFGTARSGICTGDDFRFLRLLWEVRASDIGREGFIPISKGGEYGTLVDPIHLCLDWRARGEDIRLLSGARVQGVGDFFRQGISYPLRTFSALGAKFLPGDVIVSNLSQFIMAESELEACWLIGLLHSRFVQANLELAIGAGDATTSGGTARSFTASAVGLVPLPKHFDEYRMIVAQEVLAAHRIAVHLHASDDTSLWFSGLLVREHSTFKDSVRHAWQEHWSARSRLFESWERVERLLSRAETLEIRRWVDDMLGPSPIEYGDSTHEEWPTGIIHSSVDELAEIAKARGLAVGAHITRKCFQADRIVEVLSHVWRCHPRVIFDRLIRSEPTAEFRRATAENVLSLCVGCALGRWTIVDCTSKSSSREYESPYDAPPRLQVHNASSSAEARFIVDDPGHACDVMDALRRVLHEVYGEAGDAFVQELRGTIDNEAEDLRSWFQGRFFEDHVARYSRSRRKAPIYWQIATPSGSYSLWLYYHHLTPDTYFRALSDYVKPKVEHELRRLDRQRGEAVGEPTRSQRAEIGVQEAFVAELKSFQEEIERIAPLWNPDLNDGVIINFAPLWRLVPQHRAWQKECKECWDSLIAGEYDWSHMAMHLWPERVVPKCADDRSLAIAHDLEEFFWEPIPAGEQDGPASKRRKKAAEKKTQNTQLLKGGDESDGDNGDEEVAPAARVKWRQKMVSKEQIQALIRERTKPAVKAALESLLSAPATGSNGRGRRGVSGRRTKKR